MRRGTVGWVVAAAISVAAIGAAVAFVGCGGIGVKMTEPIKVEPIQIGSPLKMEPLKIEGPMPVKMEGGVPITLTGPVTVKIEGPSVEYQGTYVSEALMERIQLGTTDPEWILAVIGKPDFTTKMSDGSEIWKWVYRPAGSQLALLTLPGQDKQPPQPQPITAYVRIKGGVVVDKWRG